MELCTGIEKFLWEMTDDKILMNKQLEHDTIKKKMKEITVLNIVTI